MRTVTTTGAGAHTQAALRSALELRYQVYCIECNFLSPEDYPDGVETDEYDERSYHFYAFDEDEELVGYVRLVRAENGQHFPFQRHCQLTEGVQLPLASRSAEISRLMVRKEFRRQPDRLANVTARQNEEARAGDRRHEAAGVLLTLYRQMYQFSQSHGLDHLYAAMERPLARSLSRMGFQFDAIGPATDYYGPVSPYLTDLRQMRARVQAQDPRMAWLQPPAAPRLVSERLPIAAVGNRRAMERETFASLPEQQMVSLPSPLRQAA